MNLNMMSRSWQGFLITFCGLDGCGKSTLIEMLNQYFNELNITPVNTKQPTNTVRKNPIFRTFMDQENHDEYDYRSLSLLAASDRIQHSNRFILPKLKEQEVVISDRYFYSCLANLRARGYKKDQWIYEIVQSIPKPDIAFFLDSPVKLTVERVRSRPEEKDSFIDIDLQHKLKEEYINIAKTNNGVIIPTDANAETAFKKIKKHVKKVMELQDA